MNLFRAILFNIFLQIWTICMAFVFAPSLFLPSRYVMRIAQVWSGGVTVLASVFMGIKAEIRGREHLQDKRVIVAAKHQSAWETIKLSNLVDLPSTVLKNELAHMFLYGYYFRRAGMIPVDREGGAGAIRKMIRLAAQRLDEGRTIIIYPEGTRTPIGQKPRYFPGVAGLYKELGVPVVPIALNSALYWRRGQLAKTPGTIIIEALPPIPPGLDRKTFLRELEERIETATARLVEEGRADLRRRGLDDLSGE
ncbi:MAG: lysophospholipid acyltransferase family protein [Pseudomonadota bacterium]